MSAKRGRPPTKGETRTVVMRFRTKPSAAKAFLAAAAEQGMEPADAMREAMKLWMATARS